MAGLFFGGIGLIICIILSVVLMVVGLFLSNVLVFDTIGLSIVAGALAANYLPIHPAFCLLIGIATFVLLFVLQQTSIGFWLISIIMSLFFALIVATFTYSSANNDWTWTYVTLGIAFVVILGLHIKARN